MYPGLEGVYMLFPRLLGFVGSRLSASCSLLKHPLVPSPSPSGERSLLWTASTTRTATARTLETRAVAVSGAGTHLGCLLVVLLHFLHLHGTRSETPEV